MSDLEALAPDELTALEGLLDEQARLLDVRRSQLSSLSGAIVDQDDRAVERLLRQIEQAQQLQARTDARLASARRALAGRAGIEPDELRLGWLAQHLPGEQGERIARARQRIIDLAEALQHEHMRTVLLLSECMRINRQLLESLLPGGGVTTYGAGGSSWYRSGAGLVDTER